LEKVLVRHPKVRDRIEVLDPCGVEEARDVNRMLGGIHSDLYDAVGDDRDRTLVVAPGSPQAPPARMPRTFAVTEVLSLAFEVLGERIDGGGRIPTRPCPLAAAGPRMRRLGGTCHDASRESVKTFNLFWGLG
jgi:hypothetical protein